MKRTKPAPARVARAAAAARQRVRAIKAEPAPAATERDAAVDPLTAALGANLRRLRSGLGWSLERLSDESGVSRSMLGQIELSQSAPTIGVLWKIARSLQVPFSALLVDSTRRRTHLMPAAQAQTLTSSDGGFVSRPLFRHDTSRGAELYELRLAPGKREEAEAHAPGTLENLIVNHGEIELSIGDERHVLPRGDAIQFEADVPHVYHNRGRSEAVLYLCMTYGDKGPS